MAGGTATSHRPAPKLLIGQKEENAQLTAYKAKLDKVRNLKHNIVSINAILNLDDSFDLKSYTSAFDKVFEELTELQAYEKALSELATARAAIPSDGPAVDPVLQQDETKLKEDFEKFKTKYSKVVDLTVPEELPPLTFPQLKDDAKDSDVTTFRVECQKTIARLIDRVQEYLELEKATGKIPASDPPGFPGKAWDLTLLRTNLGKALDPSSEDGNLVALDKYLTTLAKVEEDVAKALISSVAQATDIRTSKVSGISNVEGSRSVQVGNISTQLLILVSKLRSLSDESKFGVITAKISEHQKALARIKESRNLFLSLQDPLMGKETSGWVTESIRLFYFNDVKRLMTTLNPYTRIANPQDAEFATTADQALKTLRQIEEERAIQFHAASELANRLADLKSAQADAHRRLAVAQRRADEAQNRSDKLAYRFKDSDAATATVAEDTKAVTLAQAELAKTTDDILRAEAQKKLDAANAQLASDKAKEAAANAAVEPYKPQREALSRALTDSQATLTKAQKESDDADDATSGTQAKINAVAEKLSIARKSLVQARVTARQAAQDESDAFAKARDNQTYLIAPPIGNEADPLQRVVMYGYGDSLTIVIRGAPEDVEVARNAIALFDKPAPQARVSLYTLQMNGTASTHGTWLGGGGIKSPLNKAVRGVSNELRDLRTIIAAVQEALRESIQKEVAHSQTVAKNYLGEHWTEIEKHPPLARSFFYSDEVRSRLGFTEYFYGGPISQDMRKHAYCQADYKQIRFALRTFRSLTSSQSDVMRQAWLLLNAVQRLELEGRSLPDGLKSDNLAAGLENIRKLLERDLNRKGLVRPGELANALADSLKLNAPANQGDIEHRLEALESQVAVILGRQTNVPKPPVSVRKPDGQLTDAEFLTRFTLPDPARVTTLGEMMFVLSLASNESRARVLDRFAAELGSTMTAPRKDTSDKSYGQAIFTIEKSFAELFLHPGKTPLYPQFLKMLQNSSRNDGDVAEMSGNQLEVLQAVETKARAAAAWEIRNIIQEIGDGKDQFGESPNAEELRSRYRPLVGWLQAKVNPKTLGNGESSWTSLGGNYLSKIRNRSNEDGKGNAPESENVVEDRAAWELSKLVSSRYDLAQARPRVAAADEMIKRLIIAAEGDLEHFIIDPALDEIRTHVMSQGVEVGVLQKQSMLATNRLISRVATNANASANLTQTSDLRDDAGALVNMVNQGKANLVSPGLSTAGVGYAAARLANKGDFPAFSPWGAATFAGLADVLSQQNTEPAGEVYSINSNGVFKITPIFDPSGQAMQFQFDQVIQTNVQEPNGTTNRSLPQIENHTINERVQVSNLEFREVASFGANYKIGTPNEKKGGVPFIRDLPLIRDIPLLGYYSKKDSQAAIRQESLIFAQTSIYPTVGDIVDLLLDAVPYPSYSVTPPSYLKKTLAKTAKSQ